MTRSEFNAACMGLTIDPSLALENENIVQALQDRDAAKVLQILAEEF